MNVSVVTGPATEPLSLEEAKNHIRVEHSEDDTLISVLVVAAREYCENYLNRALITQTRKLSISEWPWLSLRLPGQPVQSIDSVTYTDSENLIGTVDPENYFLTPSGELARDYGGSWPSVTLRGSESIYITYVCGYGDAEDVPKTIKQAMLLLVGNWYSRRESAVDTSMQEIPFGVKELLSPIRDVPV